MGSSLLNVYPGSFMYFVLIAVTLLLMVLFIKLFKNKPEKSKRYAVAILFFIATLIFVLSKVFMLFDANYAASRAIIGKGPYNIWRELPLHLCNINIILVIIGVLTNYKPILSFNFYFGTLGALFAIVMPDLSDVLVPSLFHPRIISFYIPHLILLTLSPILLSLKLYKPKYKDIPFVMVVLLVLSVLMTGVNYLFRSLALSSEANYFFTIEPEGVSLLKLFYSIIPVPLLYLLPCIAIAIPFMLLITFVYNTVNKNR